MLDMRNPIESTEEVVVHHRLWRRAPQIAVGLGVAAGLAIAVFHTTAPWWMPIFAGCVVAIVAYRILRPRIRKPTIEDEI